MILNESEYQEFLIKKVVDEGVNVFITGAGGTGKTCLLEDMVERCESRSKGSTVVLAYTGVAARNAGGHTINSYFNMTTSIYHPGTRPLSLSRFSDGAIKAITKLEVIFIDEVSMLRADLLERISEGLKLICGINMPFAGKQVVLFGDMYQLPPVSTKKDKKEYVGLNSYYASSYFFDAPSFKALPFEGYELTRIYRQTDEKFIKALNNIRVGNPYFTELDYINSNCFENDKVDMDRAIYLCHENDLVDEVNRTKLAALPGSEGIYYKHEFGDVSGIEPLYDYPLRVKVNARVMFVRNDPKRSGRRWVNGTVGVVTAMDDYTITVQIDDGELVTVTPYHSEKWEEKSINVKESSNINEPDGWVLNDDEFAQDVRVCTGYISQMPLRLAWAITIHKCQGLTFDHVIIDWAGGIWYPALTYVALSRCRSVDKLHLKKPLRMQYVKADLQVSGWLKEFVEPLHVRST